MEEAELARDRWGLRFVRRETELAYREWHIDQAIPFTRVGMIASLLNWFLGVAMLWLASFREPLRISLIVLLGPVPPITAALIATSRARRLILPLTALANTVAGGAMLLIVAVVLGRPDLAAAPVTLIAFFGFTIFRLRPSVALLAVSPYTLAADLYFFFAWRAGRMPFGDMVFFTTIVVIAMLSGVLACGVLDIVSRNSFAQQHTVERQKKQLAEERAKSEGLLAGLLRQQVNARSRELTELLSRVTLPTLPFAPHAGDRFAERYRIGRRLGEGGMGVVYQVTRDADQSEFALKVMTGALSGSAAARITREAEIGTRVQHENVVDTVDVGVAPTGHPFVVMELVRGGSLEDQRQNYGDAAWSRTLLTTLRAGSRPSTAMRSSIAISSRATCSLPKPAVPRSLISGSRVSTRRRAATTILPLLPCHARSSPRKAP